MNKEALLQEVYEKSFNDEIDKIAKASEVTAGETVAWGAGIGAAGGAGAAMTNYYRPMKKLIKAPLIGAAIGATAMGGAALWDKYKK